ncbi:MAG: glycosyltransferase family 9 protein [Deltaproteobacteria bacterium]|nr:glycosyltransferase family 9 protein [Deltaproteobacteria bacterium]
MHALAALFARKNLPYLGSGQDIKKILFIRIDRIGDIVLSTPALKAVKEAYPHSKITVLASPSNSPLVFNNPNIDYIVVYDRRGRLIDRIRVIQKLRESSFDLAIDPYPDYELRTAVISFLSGARKRVGYASYGREVLFTLRAPRIDDNKHFVDITLGVLKPLGIHAGDKAPEVFLAHEERQWARTWLKERGVWGEQIVGIHPGGHYESQRWPPESYADLMDQLQEWKGVALIIFGAPGEEPLIKKICSMVTGEVVTFLEDDIRRFAALLSYCFVFIGNNSGPLHVAAGLGIATISFMGPTNKARWMPIGDIHTVFRMDDLPCIGCNRGYCKIKTHDCMRLITPSMVLEAARGILQVGNSRT